MGNHNSTPSILWFPISIQEGIVLWIKPLRCGCSCVLEPASCFYPWLPTSMAGIQLPTGLSVVIRVNQLESGLSNTKYKVREETRRGLFILWEKEEDEWTMNSWINVTKWIKTILGYLTQVFETWRYKHGFLILEYSKRLYHSTDPCGGQAQSSPSSMSCCKGIKI